MNAKKVQLRIECDYKNVALIGTVVNALCSSFVDSPQESDDIELSVVEVINNVIEHAYENQEGKKHEVELSIAIHEDRISFEIRDRGKKFEEYQRLYNDDSPFNFNPDDIDSLPEGGMGFAIVNAIMDSVDYSYEDGWNTLKLTKRFQ